MFAISSNPEYAVYSNSLLMKYRNQLLENVKKRKFYSFFKGNIWGPDIVEMQWISK